MKGVIYARYSSDNQREESKILSFALEQRLAVVPFDLSRIMLCMKTGEKQHVFIF